MHEDGGKLQGPKNVYTVYNRHKNGIQICVFKKISFKCLQ